MSSLESFFYNWFLLVIACWQLMNLLFSFLEPEHPHSTLLAGYFSKVVLCWTSRIWFIFYFGGMVLLSMWTCSIIHSIWAPPFASFYFVLKGIINNILHGAICEFLFLGCHMPLVAEDSSFYALCSSKSLLSSHLIEIFSLVML